MYTILCISLIEARFVRLGFRTSDAKHHNDFLKHYAVSWMYSTDLAFSTGTQIRRVRGSKQETEWPLVSFNSILKRGEHLLSINELQPAQNPCINLVVNIESSACIHSFHYGNNDEFIEVVNPMLSVCLSCLYHA